MPPLIESLFFLLVSGVLFFVPGFLIFCAFFRRIRTVFSSFETLLFSFGISIGVLDFSLLTLDATHIIFTPISISLCLFGIVLSAFMIARLAARFFPVTETPDTTIAPEHPRFSKRQGVLFAFLIALTISIKVLYLADAVLPTATDLGHHMYWSKLIAENKTLPAYEKQEIVVREDGTYALSEPQPIADFIIGEHLPFAAIALFAKTDFFSAFPVVFLFLINLLSVLALAFFAFRLASGFNVPSFFSKNIFTPENVLLIALFLFGPLYALASPQAKFVSGGVVGNTFGNLFIPLIILISFRAFREKRPGFLALAFFLLFTLAYTHHLSTLILLFALAAIAGTHIVFCFGTLEKTLHAWKKLFFSPAPILVALFATLFFFLIAMPTYIEQSAVGTALGTPTKTTRTGLSFAQMAASNGEARVALGLAGILFLLSLKEMRRCYATTFLLGWSIVLLVLTLRPHWLFIDIPSNRIGTYLSFPLGISAAIFLTMLLAAFREQKNVSIPIRLTTILLLTLFIFPTGSGSFDNSQTIIPQSKALPALETFAATRYLAEHNRKEDVILKDHNYLAADSWMKLFFLRDYAYPLSRGFFKRYEDNPDREQCTLRMISTPNLPAGEKCSLETGTNLVMVNPRFDGAQFEKSGTFSKIYASDLVAIYKKH